MPTGRRKLFSVLITALVFAPTVQAATFESGVTQTQLLELYSSEGCSSCPPADQWIGRLTTYGGLWREVVPAVFHVTYWDYLGWKDKFARSDFTNRQYAYVKSWNGNSAYTPGMVLSGREWRDWYRARTIPKGTNTVGNLRATDVTPNRFEIHFKPEQTSNTEWQAHVALLGFGVPSSIKEGENHGKNLTHNFLVLDYGSQSLSSGVGGLSASVSLARAPSSDASHYGIAVWVTRRGDVLPVQATGGYLS